MSGVCTHRMRQATRRRAAQDDRRFVPLPVFPSRVFRHSSIYVRSESGVARPGELAGKRIGVPEWAQTAAVYSRGLLAHEHGVDLASIEWVQAGVNEAGRREKVALELPHGFRLEVLQQGQRSRQLAVQVSNPRRKKFASQLGDSGCVRGVRSLAGGIPFPNSSGYLA